MLSVENHLNELKLRSVYILILFKLTFLCCYLYVDTIIYIIVNPFLKYRFDKLHITNYDFISTNMLEVFYTYIFVSILVTFILIIPLIIYIVFEFLSVGLYIYERIWLKNLLVVCLLLSITAIIFVYICLLPLFINFFLNLEEYQNTFFYIVKVEQKIFDYIYFTTKLLGLAIFFGQLPLIIYILLISKIITLDFMNLNRKLFIVICFIVGCILSTPEIYSLLLIAIPLLLSFETMCIVFEVKRSYNVYFKNLLNNC